MKLYLNLTTPRQSFPSTLCDVHVRHMSNIVVGKYSFCMNMNVSLKSLIYSFHQALKLFHLVEVVTVRAISIDLKERVSCYGKITSNNLKTVLLVLYVLSSLNHAANYNKPNFYLWQLVYNKKCCRKLRVLLLLEVLVLWMKWLFDWNPCHGAWHEHFLSVLLLSAEPVVHNLIPLHQSGVGSSQRDVTIN